MANKEHVRILKRGAAEWNRWRIENPDVLPDLSRYDFSYLAEDFLRQQADVYEAFTHLVIDDTQPITMEETDSVQGLGLPQNNPFINLQGANLQGTRFEFSNLTGVDLSHADLSGANFSYAKLNSAILSHADLTRSYLQWADLSQARLDGTNFDAAFMASTSLGGLDLRRTKGLESIRHNNLSFIDISTIFLSGGEIPEVFLRGVGVPERMINYTQALVGRAIEFYSCFISYSSKDQQIVERIYADLQSKGVRCWFAPEDMKIGDETRTRIDESIRVHDKLLLVLSEHSISSSWVKDEVEAALEKERRQGNTVLFPVTLDDAVWDSNEAWAAKIRRERHIGDFRQWKDHDDYMKVFERLLKDLKAKVEHHTRETISTMACNF